MAGTEGNSGSLERSHSPEVDSDTRNTAKQPRKTQRSDAERRGYRYAQTLHKYLKSKGGVFLRGEDGGLHVLVDGRRIPLNYDKDNELLASLMLEACGVSTQLVSNGNNDDSLWVEHPYGTRSNSLLATYARHSATLSACLWRRKRVRHRR